MFEIQTSEDVLNARIEVMQVFEALVKQGEGLQDIVDQLCSKRFGASRHRLRDLFDTSNQLSVFLGIPKKYCVLK